MKANVTRISATMPNVQTNCLLNHKHCVDPLALMPCRYKFVKQVYIFLVCVRRFCWKMGNTSTYTLISRQQIEVRATLTTTRWFTCTTLSCSGRVTSAARGSGKREMGFIDWLVLTHWSYVLLALTHRYIVSLWICNNTKPFPCDQVTNDTPSQVDIIASAYHCIIVHTGQYAINK